MNYPSDTSAEAIDLYNKSIEGIDQIKPIMLGKCTTSSFIEDPRHLLFTLSRYKFVAKMFDGFSSVLEIGCQEGFGASLISQSCINYTGVDFYKPYIDSAKSLYANSRNTTFYHHDILSGPLNDLPYDGVFALDVLEHIDPASEHIFMRNILPNLIAENTPLILGIPSLESQQYASKRAKLGHVNCKSKSQLKEFCKTYFHNVFMFSMNDEVLHTGFDPMSHYVIALCCSPK